MTTDPLFKVVQNYPAFHNHSKNKENIDAQHFRKNLKGKIDKDPTQVLKTVYDNFLSKTKKTVPCYASVKSTMQRHRAKKLPANPISFETTIKGKWAKTINGKQFLIKNDKKNGIVIFAMEKSLKILGKSATILCDGTFKCCPPHRSNSMFFLGNIYKLKSIRLFSLFSVVSRRLSIGSCSNILPIKGRFLEFQGRPKLLSLIMKKQFSVQSRQIFRPGHTKGVFFSLQEVSTEKFSRWEWLKHTQKKSNVEIFLRKNHGLGIFARKWNFDMYSQFASWPSNNFSSTKSKNCRFLEIFSSNMDLNFRYFNLKHAGPWASFENNKRLWSLEWYLE